MFIREIRIRRFRGIEELIWQPSPGLNCLIGPGDVGKTTILAALELLLAPRPIGAATEHDYWNRNVDAGFEISAVLGSLPPELTSDSRVPLLLGWKDGKVASLPDEDGAEPVMLVQVRGTDDLEVQHVVRDANDGEVAFTVGMRRKLLATRLTAADRAYNELRLGKGTLLQRRTADTDVRSAVVDAVSEASSSLKLPPDVDGALNELREQFASFGLPDKLLLGLISPRGQTLVGLVGLLEGADAKEAIPVAFAGGGTRQLALFALASGLVGEEPVLLIDEPESGLEPYRQRHLIRRIRDLTGSNGQAFITTHSPSILGQLSGGEVFRVDDDKSVVRLDPTRVDKLLKEDPEALLSRLPILCEGDTEAGFLPVMLQPKAQAGGLDDLDSQGLHFSAREGQPQVLQEGRALADAGIRFGLFVDNEDKDSGTRKQLAETPECNFGGWSGDVHDVEEAVAKFLPAEHLPRVVEVAASVSPRRNAAQLVQQLGDAAGSPGKRTFEELAKLLGEAQLRAALAKAMRGKVGQDWFKSRVGGEALGQLLLEVGTPPDIEKVIDDFWTALRLGLDDGSRKMQEGSAV